MPTIEVELLSQASNAVVIQTPGRRFPGIVIQGDSLKNLLHHAQALATHSKEGCSEEMIDIIIELKNLLQGYVDAYESALRSNDRELPYR